jgi:hypothetical protein
VPQGATRARLVITCDVQTPGVIRGELVQTVNILQP